MLRCTSSTAVSKDIQLQLTMETPTRRESLVEGIQIHSNTSSSPISIHSSASNYVFATVPDSSTCSECTSDSSFGQIEDSPQSESSNRSNTSTGLPGSVLDILNASCGCTRNELNCIFSIPNVLDIIKSVSSSTSGMSRNAFKRYILNAMVFSASRNTQDMTITFKHNLNGVPVCARKWCEVYKVP